VELNGKLNEPKGEGINMGKSMAQKEVLV